MKGLVLKDIYSIRFQLIVSFLIMLFPNIMLMLGGSGAALSANYSSESEILSAFMYGLVNYITITVFSSFLLNTLESDVNSGWAKMQRTMPVSGGQIIGGKLLATLAIIGAMVLVSLLFNLLGAVVFGLDLELLAAIPLCCGLLQVITLSPTFPLSMKLGVKYATAIYLTLVIIIAIAAIIVVFASLSSDISAAAMRVIFYGALPLVSAAVLAASFAAGRKTCSADL